ncbi:hypothetical protein KIN20_022029 [Parelaphostrongylus tenuis]|uniref:Uncharacterized protein n=1 Tax=Parelaphostrongylus tenuis TaxID=148309 RepID=A0AAD5MQ28_PARTN|nr:hypothetical protein KIN20_022029 [Parelaphostrongylus tenuis]
MLWPSTAWTITLLSVVLTAVPAQEICFPDTCFDPAEDNFFSYNACCENECCYRLRFWVIPACIAAVGFLSGAFFALCFQCR